MSTPTSTREFFLANAGSGYANLAERTVDLPSLKNGEVLVKIHAVSLQYRDVMVTAGLYPGVKESVVPCSDMAGEVIAVGSEVGGAWKVGDRVCANLSPEHIYGDITEASLKAELGGCSDGVLTQYKAFKPHGLVAIPKHLSYEEASTLPCAALTAYNALLGARPMKAGDTILILGTGGVSVFGLQIGVATGAEVIVTSSSDKKLAIAKELGATHLINYSQTPEWEKEVLKVTGGRGVDHVLEIGGSGTLIKSIQSARYGGFVRIIGGRAEGGEAGSAIWLSVGRAVTMRGIHIGSVTQFEDMNRLLTAHPEKTRPVIAKVFPFSQAIEAFKSLDSQAHVGKVVISLEDM